MFSNHVVNSPGRTICAFCRTCMPSRHINPANWRRTLDSFSVSRRCCGLGSSLLHRRAPRHVRLPLVGDLTPDERTIEATIRQGSEDLNPYPYKPKVHFRPDGSFKLLVMSDLHFGENPWDVWGPEQDKNSTALVGHFAPNFGTGGMNEAP